MYTGKKRVGSGFALIELLVVVLIVGILAAVALPQYQVAVMKSQFSTLYNLAMTYHRIIQEYELANGSYPTSFEDLILEKSGGMHEVTPSYGWYSCITDDSFYCCLIPNVSGSSSQAINCGDSEYRIAFHYMNESSLNIKYCVAKTDNSVASKVCAALGVKNTGWQLFSPKGTKTGYMYYAMNQ